MAFPLSKFITTLQNLHYAPCGSPWKARFDTTCLLQHHWTTPRNHYLGDTRTCYRFPKSPIEEVECRKAHIHCGFGWVLAPYRLGHTGKRCYLLYLTDLHYGYFFSYWFISSISCIVYCSRMPTFFFSFSCIRFKTAHFPVSRSLMLWIFFV